MSKRRAPAPDGAPPATLGTLGDLLSQRGLAPAPPAPPSAPVSRPPAPSPDAPELTRCGKLTVRRERKGHGGKTATVVTGLTCSARDLDRLARALRRALGCGASVDGDRLVVQGDQASRVQTWLTAQGARRVVLGN